MSYAIVKIGGKQYKVSPREKILVDRIKGDKGEKIEIKDVLLLVQDGKTLIGTPNVEGLTAGATILDQVKGEKKRVVKFKPKSRYKRIIGSRRFLTRLEVSSFKEKKVKSS